MSESKESKSGCPFLSSNQVFEFGSDVAKHVRCFAASDGKTLTRKSMLDAHTQQGIKDGVSIKIRAIKNMMKGKPSEVETIAGFINPASSGLWDHKGNFDEKQFDLLAAKCITVEDHKIITYEIFQDFVDTLHGDKDTGIATKIFKLVPVSWKKVTQGSIKELFEYYSDFWYKNNKGKYEKAMTIQHLKDFYTNPDLVMSRRIRGEFALPKPS
jgi:hypothetical protein